MSPLVRYPGPGCVVEFLHGNKTNVAWVLAEQSGRFRLLTRNNRESKLPAGRLLPWTGPAYDPDQSREAIAEILERHDAERETLSAQVDPGEIWEMAQGDLARASVEWFAGLVWDDPDVDRIAALGRRMLEQKSHFKFQPPDFEVYPRERVEQRLAEQEQQKRREAIVSAGQGFFHELWDAHVKGRQGVASPGTEEDAVLKDVLFAAMADASGTPEASIWATLKKGLPEDPHLPLYLARAWGIVPEHFYIQPLIEGYRFGDDWAAAHADAVADAERRLAELQNEPEPTPFVSVDSASTHDIDDAFYIERTADGGYHLQLALACPALTWDFGTELDRDVRERASSVYLPEGVSHMLPEDYGIKLFSLFEDSVRPALVVDARLDADAALLSMQPRFAWVRVAENTTYEAMETALADSAPDAQPALAAELGDKLRARRIAKGAVVVDRPDPVIRLEGEGAATRVHIDPSPEYPRAQVAVSEFMILANSSCGQWAHDNGVPVIYRTQDITLPGDAAGVWTTPEDAYRVVRHMAPTCQELTPRRHATIGATAYAPVTSPIRRYADLVNEAQILTHLRTGAPLWDAEEMGRMLPHITARTEAAGRIQRFRPRYWKLVYFKQRRKEMFEAVAVDEGQFVNLALPLEQIYIRAPRELLGDKIYPGQRFLIRLTKIHPLRNEIRVAEAMEQ